MRTEYLFVNADPSFLASWVNAWIDQCENPRKTLDTNGRFQSRVFASAINTDMGRIIFCVGDVENGQQVKWRAREIVGCVAHVVIDPIASQKAEVRLSSLNRGDSLVDALLVGIARRWTIEPIDYETTHPQSPKVVTVEEFYKGTPEQFLTNITEFNGEAVLAPSNCRLLFEVHKGEGRYKQEIELTISSNPIANSEQTSTGEISQNTCATKAARVSARRFFNRGTVLVLTCEREFWDEVGEWWRGLVSHLVERELIEVPETDADSVDEVGSDTGQSLFGCLRQPTDKTKERAEVFKQLKDEHPSWSQDRVAIEGGEILGEYVTSETVRNSYRAMGWKWHRGDRAR